jgi:hypothetical protein
MCSAATMLAIFGGDTNVLRTVLLEERIPDGWEPHVRSVCLSSLIRRYRSLTQTMMRHRSRKGLSIAEFNPVVLSIHLRINEKKAAKEMNKKI